MVPERDDGDRRLPTPMDSGHRRHFQKVDRIVRVMTHTFFALLVLLVLAYFGVLWGLVEPGLRVPGF